MPAKIKRKKFRTGKTSVYLNGRLVGFSESGAELLATLREQRRSAAISSEVNFHLNERTEELYVNTDAGRARRPYIIVENGKSKLIPSIIPQIRAGEISWAKLVQLGIIEYLDAEEEEGAYIALKEEELTPQHTHLEIDPISIVGVTVSVLPYPEYNSSPRITMACAMAKQSLGTYIINYNLRTDSRAHIMSYPQQPLAQTRPYKLLKFAERAAGQNFVVAITSYRGYNMGDAIVMNKSAIDRGLGRSVFYKNYEAEERRYPGGQKDKFEIPPATTAGYRDEQAYKYLDSDGIVMPEVEVRNKEVLVGKTSPPRFLEEVTVFGVVEEKKRENSLAVKSGENGSVDSVMVTDSLSGNKMAKIRLRSIKIPEIGDKFASRHGQKGVIGLVMPQHDMPFTKDGIVPDLIINPHAIPSRMTVGHLLEMLGGKSACMSGKFADASAFAGDTGNDFRKILSEFGMQEYGEETLYDGLTGEKIKAKIYIGVIYYQKLHHLVSNKMHVRSRGPVQLLTHQPTEGRAREGGLRFGEMERDCLIGYGASMLLRERMLEESDRTIELVCSKCGSIAVHDHIKNRDYCPVCDSTSLEMVEMSYAFKLLLDEIKSLGIFPRLLLKMKC
ncbi:DNA-directed RNA polymerase subunit B [Candidatus Micrarchaeota archaeon CG1_02_47_40]|nr:MAG: DNA-directed RNA polymerase subunit B [Candidatus Micrarchaeota archaeon CG1_02_47_40]